MGLRVVQWTTGTTGKAAVRGIVGHPALELVGCYAFSSNKVGRDVGELCGMSPLGITASDDGHDMTPSWPVEKGYVEAAPRRVLRHRRGRLG